VELVRGWRDSSRARVDVDGASAGGATSPWPLGVAVPASTRIGAAARPCGVRIQFFVQAALGTGERIEARKSWGLAPPRRPLPAQI